MTHSITDDRTNLNSSTDAGTTNPATINNPLAEQADKLKGILFTKDTATTLGQSVRLIFVVLKEALVLAWLALCWGIVAIGWLGNKSTQTGQQLRQQLTTFQETHQDQTASDIATETSKSVLNSSKTVVEQILTEAKKQVGLLDE
ncbi:hypothetical protein K9N68_35790 (plasmid) [Kovacikia minuta CCNUW1]|uniref:hypothetical protein n=1 Tax=Kovacikia minuta TaxID=2931930 RepID=UPI001CCDDA4B|nr:hypothetical protein [Kovacikia minuta]UBF30542.1 hypothetical protein K9N68_35790 [Kovacikia minuta CCNUW1]